MNDDYVCPLPIRTYKAKLLLQPECIPLDGEDPPSGLINPEYKPQPSNPRKCIECGKRHDTIAEDTRTGERLSEIDKCNDCLMSKCFRSWVDES